MFRILRGMICDNSLQVEFRWIFDVAVRFSGLKFSKNIEIKTLKYTNKKDSQACNRFGFGLHDVRGIRASHGLDAVPWQALGDLGRFENPCFCVETC